MPKTNEEVWQNKWTGRHEPVNAFAKSVVRRLGKGRSRKLLDLGCGRGVDSVFFAGQGFHVTAADFSPSGIQELQRDLDACGAKSVHPLLHDISQTLPFADASFDAVYAHLSVHYFDDAVTRSVFAEMRRVLKPSGFLFVKCKSTDDGLYGVGEQVGPDMFRSDHTRHFFSAEYMRSMLADFEVLSMRKSSAAYHGKRSAFVQAVAQKP